MTHLYIYSFLAGLFAANGLPNFIAGILGKKHYTPFGDSSSAAINVVWGWVNFVVAAMLLYYAGVHAHLLRAFGLFALGALLGALLVAYISTKNTKSSK